MSKRSVDNWLADADWARFSTDTILQDAVSKCVEVIGEAAGRLDDVDPALNLSFPDLDLKLARRSRHRLTHGYYSINLSILWTTATQSIPRTVAAAKQLLQMRDGDGDQQHP